MRSCIALFFGLLMAAAPAALLADTLTVTNTGDSHVDGQLSLREAVEASARGDTIAIAVTRVTLTEGEMQIGHDLTITGLVGTRLPFISRSGEFGTTLFRIFRITGGSVNLSNLYLYNGAVIGAAGASSSGNGGDSQGGAITNSGTLNLTNCDITGANAIGGAGAAGTSMVGGTGGAGRGGAIYNDKTGTLTVLDCSFGSNSAGGGDGGNSATTPGGTAGIAQGGAIYNAGTATISNCTINSNSSRGGRGGNSGSNTKGTKGGTGEAGAIYNTGSLTLVNGTLVKNNVYGGHGGAGNSMPDGDGGDVHGGALIPVGPVLGGTTIINTIVAQNILTKGTGATAGTATGTDVAGTVNSAGHNLIGDATDSNGWNSSDKLGSSSAAKDPKLVQDETLFITTLQPQTGSPATDAGDDAVLSAPYSLTTDARGLPRKVGDHVDIGACETDTPQSGPAFVVTTIHDHTDGVAGIVDCSMSEALAAANSYSGSGSITISFAGDVHGTTGGLFDAPGITKSMSIVGPTDHSVALQGSGSDQGQIFVVASGVSASIANLTFTGGRSLGVEFGPGVAGGFSTGAALRNKGTLILTSCTFTDNHSTGGKGGAKPAGAGGNGGPANGGAISNESILAVNNCTFMNNTALGGAGGAGANSGLGGAGTGAAIYNLASLMVTNSTFANNFATGGPGGAAGLGGDASGGAIYNIGTMTLSSCTFTTNAATPGDQATGSGGAIADGGGTSTLQNTLVALNTAIGGGPDVDGQFTSNGYNLIGDGSDANFVNGTNADQVGTPDHPIDPKLGMFQDNGGFVFTFALLPGSPAIDQGARAGLTTDQRGDARPFDDLSIPNAASGDGSDIGAYEVQPGPVPTPTPTITPEPTPTPTATPVPTATPGQAVNISTRMNVLTDFKVMIGGFFITGTDSKTVIIRARGPSLGSEGVQGDLLLDPTLELHQGAAVVASNDNWKVRPDGTSQQAEIEATEIPPSDDREAALVMTLDPGPYTAIVAGKDGTTGIGLVEVYDLSSATHSKLANISTRGFVETGSNVIIGGFIIRPLDGTSVKLVIRAIGPSLTSQAVDGALQDPTLELRDVNGGLLAADDNWQDDPGAAEIQASGLAPTDPRESASLQTLAPGSYTAIVRGVNDTTGVGLVEVYALN